MTTINEKTGSKDFWHKNRLLLAIVAVIAVMAGGILLYNHISDIRSLPTAYEKAGELNKESLVREITDANFDQAVAEGVVLVDFWAVWCPPCRIQGPIVEEVAHEIGKKAIVGKVDVDRNPATVMRNEIINIPTIIIFKDGQPVERFVGVQQKETLLAAIRNYI